MGAVAASSRRLAHAMTEGIGLERARLVAELGPGTGVFTDAVLARLAPGARVVTVELNPVLAARLSDTRRDTRLTVVQGSAAELAAAVGEPVDAVVSGPPARHFTAELACRFGRLERSRVVWSNLPPAFVHRATRKPAHAPRP
ncbi:class I SAM-dependent methyltransferase [Streptomyces sp. ME18-1-4]|uniref:class I SAM-dependent methyltransferase n=1 Tax=Streptomyces sp. ME18-1-4 TaxID=3028685 RepID=UPI0029A37BF4|nr:rRNA adenine N-6-methyltransferase family protein [Streptomyces sp. ME18-1-4]MDX3242786.1 rRNA adenine N-6-methyltransferase family protein [Streptomyces sp. ME18-1-4]